MELRWHPLCLEMRIYIVNRFLQISDYLNVNKYLAALKKKGEGKGVF